MQRVLHAPGANDLDPNAVGAAAERGVSGVISALPYLEQIQRSFGSHDVTAIKAHTDAPAADGAAAMGARAFATGDHVAFGDTPDLHTAAHEAAHVVQQRGGVALSSGVGAEGDSYERQADEVADRVVRGESAEALLGPGRGRGAPQTSVQRILLSEARQPLSSEQIEALKAEFPAQEAEIEARRAPGHTYIARRTPAGLQLVEVPADQRTGTGAPDEAQAQSIAQHLDPGAFAPQQPGQAPQPAEWTGRSAAADHAAARTRLRTALMGGFRAFLDSQAGQVAGAAAQPRVPMTQAGAAGQDTGVQGIAGAAAEALQGHFGEAMAPAALTAGQDAARQRPMNATSGAADQNLFDAYNLTERRDALGTDEDGYVFSTAWWMIYNAPECSGPAGTEHLGSHWYDGTEEWTFIEEAINAFSAQGTNRADLIQYRTYGWNERSSARPGIILQTNYDPASEGGDAARAARVRRWSIFETALHETLHFRTHPAFADADRGRATMLEGFTEMFAKDAGDTILPTLRAGGNEPMRHAVEGSNDPLDASVIADHYEVSSAYQDHYDHAIAIRGDVGDPACRAAYFHGHVELLGLAPDGTALGGLRPAGATPALPVPGGVANLDALATASGVPRATIEQSNAGITDALPATVVLPGCRDHIVVQSSESGGATATETRPQIAAQHGVTEAELVRANPGIAVDGAGAWPALTQNQHILIPVH